MANTGFFTQWDPNEGDPRAGRKVDDGSGTAAAAAAATAANPLGTVSITPGWTPDYKNLIMSDPSYLSWANNSQLDINQKGDARRAALQALAIQHGGLGGFVDTYGDIDPNTADLASKNQFSDTAKIARNYAQGIEAAKRALAARGGLSSGELGYSLDQADIGRASAEYDSNQQFGNQAQQIIASYVNALSNAHQGEADAIAKAEQNVYANPANRPVDGTSATLISDWKTKYSEPTYLGPDGKTLYRIGPDGNPYAWDPNGTPPPGTTPPPSDQPPALNSVAPVAPQLSSTLGQAAMSTAAARAALGYEGPVGGPRQTRWYD